MGSKMQTGLLLILGTLVSLIGWMFIYPVDGGPDATSAEKAADLMADPGLGKLGMLMGFGGMFAIFIGFLNIARKMAAGDGPGSSYANIAAILALVLATLGAMAIGMQWAVADASSEAAGAAIMQIDDSGNTSFMLVSGVLLLMLGLGMILEKNFHIVIGGLSVVTGTVMFLAPIIDQGMLGFFGWIGMMLVAIGSGIQVLRSNS